MVSLTLVLIGQNTDLFNRGYKVMGRLFYKSLFFQADSPEDGTSYDTTVSKGTSTVWGSEVTPEWSTVTKPMSTEICS